MPHMMERTCPNCKNYKIDRGVARCTLAVFATSGENPHVAWVRTNMSESLLYHSKVTEPCGQKGLYWEDGRPKREELELFVPCEGPHPLPQSIELRWKSKPKDGSERLLNIRQSGEFEKMAAEVLNETLERIHCDSTLDRAISKNAEVDVWSRPFKMEE